jgi:isopentenyl-diphosphate delta-isomerase
VVKKYLNKDVIMITEQTLILVDDKDNIIGYAPRSECHTGKGKRHRAFVILIYNKDKKILLQHRKHKLFDKVWDLTAASHPLHVNGSNENCIEAACRCLRVEWGIEKVELRKIGAYNYFKEYGNHCENEHCALIVGEYNGKIDMNSEVAYGFKWVSLKQLLSEIEKNPEIFSQWLIESVKLLKNNELEKELLEK